MTVDRNFNSWLGIAFDLDWTYNSSNGAETDIATITAGPQIYPFGHHKFTPFAHALFGARRFYYRAPCACLGASENSNHFSQYDFAWVAGGGVDYTVMKNVAIRLAQVDFEQVDFGPQASGRGPAPAKTTGNILPRFCFASNENLFPCRLSGAEADPGSRERHFRCMRGSSSAAPASEQPWQQASRRGSD